MRRFNIKKIITGEETDKKNNIGKKGGVTTQTINSQQIRQNIQKEQRKEDLKSHVKFNQFVKDTSEPILVIEGFWLFDLFPDKLVIDTERVSVVTRQFLSANKIHTVFISDITDVIVTYALLFATLTIVDRNFRENEIKVEHLLKSDALEARQVLEGLMIAKKNGINTESLRHEEDYLEQIKKLGTTT
ncbi:MAG: hypothetical protein ACOX6N_03825 [Patescibacteria group bacterium]|jgi:hypothetical protein